MRPRNGFSSLETRGATKYANKIANRKRVRVSRAECKNANTKAKMITVHRIRAVFGSQTLLSMSDLSPFAAREGHSPLSHRLRCGDPGMYVLTSEQKTTLEPPEIHAPPSNGCSNIPMNVILET